MFDEKQIEALKAPLDKSNVRTRQQAGQQLSYVEGWHVIAEANRIFGFDAWDRRTFNLSKVSEREVDGKWRVSYIARVRVTVRADGTDVVREGTGYGSGIDRDLGSAHEGAIKEAETDAMKRALMTFGNPFGLALYDKEQRDVADADAMAASAKRQTYIDACREIIKSEKNPEALANWWKDQRDDRIGYGLSQEEVDDLKNLVIARRDELTTPQKEAAE